MKATLNLRFDKSVIEAAKKYASEKQTSISEIVETHLKTLMARDKKTKFVSDDLVGILKQYKEYSDEELKEIYIGAKHHA